MKKPYNKIPLIMSPAVIAAGEHDSGVHHAREPDRKYFYKIENRSMDDHHRYAGKNFAHP